MGASGIGIRLAENFTLIPGQHDTVFADVFFDTFHTPIAVRYTDVDSGWDIFDIVPDGIDVIFDHRIELYLQEDIDMAADGSRIVGIGRDDRFSHGTLNRPPSFRTLSR